MKLFIFGVSLNILKIHFINTFWKYQFLEVGAGRSVLLDMHSGCLVILQISGRQPVVHEVQRLATAAPDEHSPIHKDTIFSHFLQNNQDPFIEFSETMVR